MWWHPALKPCSWKFTLPTPQWALTGEQSITLFMSPISIWTLHSPCLCLSLFISGVPQSFQTLNFGDLQTGTHAVSLGEVFVRFVGPSQESSQKTAWWFAVYSRKLAPGPAALHWIPSSCAWEQHSILVPSILPATQEILRPPCCSGILPLLSTWAPLSQAMSPW